MKPTLLKDRTHCSKGHDLRVHGYYFGTNQRCQVCNRGGAKTNTAQKDQILEDRPIGNADISSLRRSQPGPRKIVLQ